VEPRLEPINSEWTADIRFGAHFGLKSDITAFPKSADFVAKVGCWGDHAVYWLARRYRSAAAGSMPFFFNIDCTGGLVR
jgi:hypothetical protein